MRRQAFVGGTVIDGTSRAPLSDAVVLVEDDRVAAVTTDRNAIPADAAVVDATGRWIVPGLMDANVHLVAAKTPTLLAEFEGRYDELVEEAAGIALRAGITTVFDTWGPLDALIAVRDRIARGEVVGSRVFVAGNIVGLDGPLSGDFWANENPLDPATAARIDAAYAQGVGSDLLRRTPDEVRRRVREYIERSGVDFIKYAGSGHDQPRFLTFTAEVQRAIVEEAHRAGITAQAHTTTVESLRMEIEAGADILQHGDMTGDEPIPDATIAAIVERDLPIAAFVHITDRFLAWVHAEGPPLLRELYTPVLVANQRRLIAAGARLILMTDGSARGPRLHRDPLYSSRVSPVDFPWQLGESHHLWLETAGERGMAPMDVLRGATSHIADAYGVGAEIGTIEPGKRADLLLLDADPLADPRAYRRISAIVKDGAVVDRDALPVRRVLTEEDPHA
jgi:imidazolonepropionase-like amidohydrolase